MGCGTHSNGAHTFATAAERKSNGIPRVPPSLYLPFLRGRPRFRDSLKQAAAACERAPQRSCGCGGFSPRECSGGACGAACAPCVAGIAVAPVPVAPCAARMQSVVDSSNQHVMVIYGAAGLTRHGLRQSVQSLQPQVIAVCAAQNTGPEVFVQEPTFIGLYVPRA